MSLYGAFDKTNHLSELLDPLVTNEGVLTPAERQQKAQENLVGGLSGGRIGMVPNAAQQALSGAGAVTLTEYYTTITTTGADALTLADGSYVGQLKKIQMIVDAGDGTLTFNSTHTITFADVGDTAELMWDGDSWIVLALYNVTDGASAPAYA